MRSVRSDNTHCAFASQKVLLRSHSPAGPLCADFFAQCGVVCCRASRLVTPVAPRSIGAAAAAPISLRHLSRQPAHFALGVEWRVCNGTRNSHNPWTPSHTAQSGRYVSYNEDGVSVCHTFPISTTVVSPRTPGPSHRSEVRTG